MPKKATELSPLQVRRLVDDGLHAVGGVAGLHLQVRGSARSWILRTTIGDRRREIGLGGFPDVTLAEARDRARAVRAKASEGIDPIEERRAARAALTSVMTFDEAARRLMAAKSAEWKNPKHRGQWKATLETYASRKIGRMPVDRIALQHVVDVLTPIWTTKTETATRLRGRIESVLDWATVSGFRTGDNPARWRGNLSHALPRPGKVRKVKHHAALPVEAMPAFITDLRSRPGTAARVLEFTILTATRSQESRGAKWSELDLDAALWTIPAARMKAGKEHKVPLSPRAVQLLTSLPRFAGVELLFPSSAGLMLSDMSLSAVTRRMGVDAVPHGFRSTFRDWASEHTNYPRDVAEMALAHTIGDKVEAAYRRGELLAKRTRMMTDWSRFIDAQPHGGNVTQIRRRAG